jgi:hypothetical protein
VGPAQESPREAPGAVFRSGGIADRGPLERGTPLPEPRARESREYERQAEWRASASRALTELQVEDVEQADAATETVDAGPMSAQDAPRRSRSGAGNGSSRSSATGATTPSTSVTSTGAISATSAGEPAGGPDDPSDRFSDEDATLIRLSERQEGPPLEPLSVLGYGISRKRLEQAIRDLQLPVFIVHEPDEADLVITLRSAYKQKVPILREAEAHGLPIYVLKSNTVAQIQAILTSLYALETDPQRLAMRELEEAIGLVRAESKPVELSPQNAFVRKLQHRGAEAANLVSRSRGREPFRRVRVYPEKARAWH